MALKDYSEEYDYYSQGFEKQGVVSIWVGLLDDEEDEEGIDVLQDLAGVGYYDLAFQEGNCFDYEMVSLRELLSELSYSYSFITEALLSAKVKEIFKALRVNNQ